MALRSVAGMDCDLYASDLRHKGKQNMSGRPLVNTYAPAAPVNERDLWEFRARWNDDAAEKSRRGLGGDPGQAARYADAAEGYRRLLRDEWGRPLKLCDNPACGRSTKQGVHYCCGGCRRAHGMNAEPHGRYAPVVG